MKTRVFFALHTWEERNSIISSMHLGTKGGMAEGASFEVQGMFFVRKEIHSQETERGAWVWQEASKRALGFRAATKDVWHMEQELGGQGTPRSPWLWATVEGTRKEKKMAPRAWVKTPFSLMGWCMSLTLERIGVGLVEDRWLRKREAEQLVTGKRKAMQAPPLRTYSSTDSVCLRFLWRNCFKKLQPCSITGKCSE